MTREEVLLKSAAQLRESAEALRRAHTLDGKWVLLHEADRKAQHDHDEMVACAAALLAMAQQR